MQGAVEAGWLLAGRYRLGAAIGRGAMGIVWRGRDELLERDVAIKEVRVPTTVSQDDAEIVYQRTLREARTAARLNHPGVVTVFDVVEENGSPWIVMEFVRARALDQIVTEDGPLRPLAAARVGECLLSALSCAHSSGVLHRDVKPSNVLIEADGRAVLTDFGIAVFEGDPGLTQVGMVVGTPGFTAPERLLGRPATPASDLWSLGATLYAAVEGRGPFERAGGPAAVVAGIVNENAPRAPSAGPLMPVIDALLRTDPEARPDAAKAARLLTEAAEGAKASLTLPGYPWPFSTATSTASTYGTSSTYGTASTGGPVSTGGPAGTDGPASTDGPGGNAAIAARPVPPGQSMPGGIPAFMTVGASPGFQAPPGEAHSPDSTDLPAFLDLPAFTDIPAFTDMSASPGVPAFLDVYQFDDQTPPPPDLAAAWNGHAGPPPPAAPNPRPRQGRALAAGLAALVVLAAGLLLGLTYANSGGQSTAQGVAGLNLGADGKNVAKAGGSAGGRAATGSAGTAKSGASNVSTSGTTGTTGGKPASATSPAPGPSSPAAGSPPAGYRWYRVSAASSGATAGFMVAVPDTWIAATRGLMTYLTSPAGSMHAKINLTPFIFADPVREARFQQTAAILQDQFPGYAGLGIKPGTFRGAADAVWRFRWRPGGGRMSAIDLLVGLDTTAGEQSYALSMSAPKPDALAAGVVFLQMLRTFQPAP